MLTFSLSNDIRLLYFLEYNSLSSQYSHSNWRIGHFLRTMSVHALSLLCSFWSLYHKPNKPFILLKLPGEWNRSLFPIFPTMVYSSDFGPWDCCVAVATNWLYGFSAVHDKDFSGVRRGLRDSVLLLCPIWWRRPLNPYDSNICAS